MKIDSKEQSNLPLRDDAMELPVLEENRWSGRRIRNTPFRRLPNCRAFRIELQGWDKLALEYGIEKKIPPKISVDKYRLGSCNRYLEHQVMRMEKARAAGNHKLLWTIAGALLRRSNVYMVSGMHRVMENWHRRYKFSSVLSITREYRHIADTFATDIELSRLYILKANGKQRPLGIPSVPWRLYLHLLNNILVFALGHRLSESQHGFQPGKGTLTAWKEVLTEVIKRENIWEFDLENFFNSVSRAKVLGMIADEVPDPIVELIRKQALSNPKMPDPSNWHTDETDTMNQYTATQDDTKPGGESWKWSNPEDGKRIHWSSYSRDTLKNPKIMGDFAGKPIGLGMMDKLRGYSLEQIQRVAKGIEALKNRYTPEYIRKQMALGFTYDQVKKRMERENQAIMEDRAYQQSPEQILKSLLPGFPQGSATSPFLSILALEQTLFQYYSPEVPRAKVVMYADDGLLCHDGPPPLPPKRHRTILPYKDVDGMTKGRVAVITPPVRKDKWEGGFPPKTDAFQEWGILINQEKSGWVKRNGHWLKPLKFLGLEYNGETDTLRASTRNGSQLPLREDIKEWVIRADNPEIHWGQLFLRNRKKARTEGRSPGMQQFAPGEASKIAERTSASMGLTWEQIVKSSVLGFVASRLYLGQWNLDIEQQFDLTFNEGSWLEWWNGKVSPDNKRKVKAILARYPRSVHEDKDKEYVFAKECFDWDSGLRLSVFNSTSVAAKSLLNILRYRKRNVTRPSQ